MGVRGGGMFPGVRADVAGVARFALVARLFLFPPAVPPLPPARAASSTPLRGGARRPRCHGLFSLFLLLIRALHAGLLLRSLSDTLTRKGWVNRACLHSGGSVTL